MRGGEQTLVRTQSSEAEGQRLVLLVMISGGVREFDLEPEREYTIGRAPEAEICIDVPSVSRTHAALTSHGEHIRVRDLGSTNGTQVNSDSLGQEPRRVEVGDAIRFGDILAQLRPASSPPWVPRLVKPNELDARLTEEAERCLRYDRTIAAITVETRERDEATADRARRVVCSSLRTLDYAATRSPGRIDVLLQECTREDARMAAERLHADLARHNLEAKLGIAAYPGDVPSPESLLLGAQLAMHSVDTGVAQALEGARMMRIGKQDVVVADEAMVRVFGLAERLAASPMSVLVQGETGVGKELVAEAVHAMGPRAPKPFLKLNCAAVPESLMESELFGYQKGAFSGADRDKVGLLEEAHEGTIFLDEIGEMAPALQAKLLRVIEDGCVRRVGATRERELDVRVVAATHRDLQELTETGEFRRDLYYRLSAMVLRVPPLRERPRDISLLCERFAAEACGKAGRSEVTIAPAAMERLKRYAWPGNIRELKNAIGAACMMCEGSELELSHFPPEIAESEEGASDASPAPAEPDRPLSLEEELRSVERRRIVEALEHTGGNQTKAAELLGLPRRTLVYKLSSLGIVKSERKKKAERDSA